MLTLLDKEPLMLRLPESEPLMLVEPESEPLMLALPDTDPLEETDELVDVHVTGPCWNGCPWSAVQGLPMGPGLAPADPVRVRP
jgi:hypothetical protein